MLFYMVGYTNNGGKAGLIQFCQYLLMIKEQEPGHLCRQDCHQGTYKNYRILLKYSPAQGGFISIQVQDTDTLERYYRQKALMDMTEAVDFKCLPNNMYETYRYLVSQFKNIVFEESGVLNFIYFWEKAGEKKQTMVKIVLKKEEVTPLDLVLRKFEKMSKEYRSSQQRVNRELIEKDAKIKRLSDRLKRALRGQKAQRENNRKKFEQISEKIHRQMREQFQRTAREQQEQAQANRQMLRQLSGRMRKDMEEQQSRHRLQLAGERQKSERLIEQLRREFQGGRPLQERQKGGLGRMVQRPAIAHHFQNLHIPYYTLTNISVNSARILREGEIGCYNFMTDAEIPHTRRKKYTIKILKTGNSNIMIGFCTNAGLGVKNNNSSPESAYYQCSGYFCRGGEYEEHNVVSKGGDTIECEADLEIGLLRWRRNGLMLKDLGVPEKMRDKGAYLSLIMTNPGDEVEVSI